MSTPYDDLIKEIPKFKELVADYPENLQPIILDALISEFRAPNRPTASDHAREHQKSTISKPKVAGSHSREIPGIALLNGDGDLKITLREVPGKTTNEKARQLAYIIIRVSEIFTGEPSVSSKRVLSPILKEWRLYTGNTRGVLAKDKGIVRDGDNLSLDVPAKKEADRILEQLREEMDE